MNNDIIEQLHELQEDFAAASNEINDSIDEIHKLITEIKEDIKAIRNEQK